MDLPVRRLTSSIEPSPALGFLHLVPMKSPVFSRVWYFPPPNDACARSHRDLIKSMDSTPGNHPVIADKVFRFAQATDEAARVTCPSDA